VRVVIISIFRSTTKFLKVLDRSQRVEAFMLSHAILAFASAFAPAFVFIFAPVFVLASVPAFVFVFANDY
jgi:hypothetical protein